MWILVAVGVFSVGVIGESLLRDLARDRLTGIPEGALPAALGVKGSVQPDFLWAGEAWHLELTNAGSTPVTSCVVVFDGKTDPGPTRPFTLLPGSSFVLYYNHDHANAPAVLPRRLTLRTAQGTFTWDIRRGP